MQSFISQTIDDILKTTTSFEEVTLILPSQRAKVFVKQEFKNKISVGFLPEIISIEQFINKVSGIEKADNIQLLFHFYTIYKSLEKDPVSFDIFSSWAITVLQDFNEIDQHLVNAKEIFVYIRDIQRLKKWSVKGEFKETDLIKDHYSFLEKLDRYYHALYTFLKDEKIGYQGLIYRESCNNLKAYLGDKTNHKFFFIGFNALNKAEEFLIQETLQNTNSQIYWDIDQAFLNSNHQSGKFIRKYKKEWKFYEKNNLKIVGNQFLEDKNIQVIGASKNITQVKYAAEILESFNNFNNTALILSDETLLPVSLISLPKNINAINITMGYPLKDIPTTGFLYAIFQLFISQEKLQKSVTNEFYFKDVITFLKHPLILKLVPDINGFIIAIAKENQTFINANHIQDLVKNTNDEVRKVISAVFCPYSSIDEFLDRILNMIALLKVEVSSIEKEYLFRFYTAFNQLKALQKSYSYFPDLKTLFLFLKQLISSETLSFQGEPLKGLQLMGMLETRVLDFENIILLSTNEGVLPANHQQNSFIPFDVKIEYDLPTYREKDAIFSYHFFRLLQRAKNVYIIYNTENDAFGGGEKSRFVTQLEMMRNDVIQKIITPKIITDKVELKTIQKNNQVLERLKEIAEKGISPSALTNYLYNPIAFYKQKVLKLKEFDDVEETVGFNTLGTVVHETLDELYKPIIGQFLTESDINIMQTKTKELVLKHFKKEFKKGDITTGKNRLIFEVAIKFVKNFLAKEKELVKDPNNKLKILGTEENLDVHILIDEFDFPIKLHGQVDRVDELNGVLRIIDYKTGFVDFANLRVPDFETLRNEKHLKAIQVLLYAFLYTSSKKYNFNQPIEAGIYSFKNLKSGFLPVNFSENSRKQDLEITKERLTNFMSQIKSYLKEIFNLNEDFIEPKDLKY